MHYNLLIPKHPKLFVDMNALNKIFHEYMIVYMEKLDKSIKLKAYSIVFTLLHKLYI